MTIAPPSPAIDAGLALSRIGFAASAPKAADTVPQNQLARAAAESATPQQQIVMLYQRMSLDVTRAVAAMQRGDSTESQAQLIHASQIVDFLRNNLNESVWDGATGLLALYQFLLESFTRAQLTMDPAVIEPCIPMIDELTETWAEVAR